MAGNQCDIFHWKCNKSVELILLADCVDFKHASRLESDLADARQQAQPLHREQFVDRKAPLIRATPKCALPCTLQAVT